MTQTEKQSWEQIREKGRQRFILQYGLLKHGLPCGAIVVLFDIIFDLSGKKPITPYELYKLGVEFAFTTLWCGWFLAVSRWQRDERDYQKSSEHDHSA
jgi:hypothetical protein